MGLKPVKVNNMASLSRISLSSLSTAARLSLRPLSTTSIRCGEGATVGTATHTGQVYAEDDYRRLRFMDKDKLVNTEWAINLIADGPVVVVNANHVFSNSGGALGHPKVYINLDKPKIGTCGYSGRKFIQAKFYKKAEHGPSITYEEYLAQVRK